MLFVMLNQTIKYLMKLLKNTKAKISVQLKFTEEFLMQKLQQVKKLSKKLKNSHKNLKMEKKTAQNTEK